MPFNEASSGVGMRLAEGIGFGGVGRLCEEVKAFTVGVDPVNFALPLRMRLLLLKSVRGPV